MKIIPIACILISTNLMASQNQLNYVIYHRQIVQAEKLIVNEKFEDALKIYEQTFSTYDFVFLREYKVATQLALQVGNHERAFAYLRKGISAGWSRKSIRKNKYLSGLRDYEEWKSIKEEYNTLYRQYEAGLNLEIGEEMHGMYKKDQWKAFQGLFTFSSNAQDRFAEKRFAPYSEKRLTRIIEIVDGYGCPGEKLVGNSLWLWGMLSHHNSISQRHAKQDTLYPNLRPKLLKGIQSGEMSPIDFAIIDEWYIIVKSARKEIAYGYVHELTQEDLVVANEQRKEIGMRSIKTRNGLVDIQNKTRMNFYLGGQPWQDGKITVGSKL